MLKLIVFVCGAALMALELVAARILAPAMGNSIFVWGSVISIVMIALSLGYWVGGQLADKRDASRVLAPIIAAAGVFTVLAPVIAAAILPHAAGLGPRLGSLVAAGLIFFVPSLLLATVSPLSVRLAASRGLDRIGRSAGGLYAISTGGSVVGTLATAFWLIPALSLEPLVVATGFVLFACSLAALALPRLYGQPLAAENGDGSTARMGAERGALLTALVLVVLGCAAGAWVLADVTPVSAISSQGETVLYRFDSQYHRISVTEANGVRHLRFDASNQTAIDLTDGYTSVIKYPNYIDLALAAKPYARRVLVLGLGGGAITKRWWRDYPQMTIDTVETDPAVIDVARRYFGLPEDQRIRVYNQDARRFVQSSLDTYDIVIVDCYYSDSLPSHLTTQEFFNEVKKRMAPNGVLAYNLIGSVSGDNSRLFRSMYRTVGTVWDHTWVFPIGLGDDGLPEQRRNIVVLATDSPVDQLELMRRIHSRVGGMVKVAGFQNFGADLYTGVVPQADVPLLTDSYAPTDSLIKVMGD
ncbi:MAG: fused MFS/spermidine synthase [Coriobacteriia bacterium]|nr:fused MFS/spermidine synthase [Coriobacteriia bacterium]